jgi:hypothetical protein
MLLAEEQAAHQQHKASSSSNSSSVHEALLQLHDSAMHQQALLQHAECVLAPAVAAMRVLSLQADVQEQQLQADTKRLQVGWLLFLADANTLLHSQCVATCLCCDASSAMRVFRVTPASCVCFTCSF